MKTLGKLERERLEQENERISHLLAIYNDEAIDFQTKSEISKRLKFTRRAIGNLEETVRIVIAKHANLLFNGIKDSLKIDEFRKLYYEDFEGYLQRVASIKVSKGKFESEKQSGYNLDIQRAILYFDFTLEEISILMNKPYTDETREEFIDMINKKYQTNIPSLEELRNANKEMPYNDTLKQIQMAKERKILQIRNGVYIQTEYPLFYENETALEYDKLLEDAKNTLKRKM